MEPSNGLGTLGEAIGLGRGRKAEKTWKKHGNLPDEYIYIVIINYIYITYMHAQYHVYSSILRIPVSLSLFIL
jgi:hypothetical protein